MSATVVVLWCIVAATGAWRWRPVPPPRGVELPSAATPEPFERPPDLLDRFGGFVIERVPLLVPIPRRRVAFVLLVGVVTSPILGVWSLVLVVAGLTIARAGGRRSASRRLDRDLSEVATIADLLAVALGSGLGLGHALVAVHERLRPEQDAGLVAVLVDLQRGRSVDDALGVWADRGDPVGELVVVLRGAERSGTSIIDGLVRLGADLRRRRRRRAEERARRLPVTMLLPLVSCVLPAFGLVTVVPMVAVGLGRLGALP